MENNVFIGQMEQQAQQETTQPKFDWNAVFSSVFGAAGSYLQSRSATPTKPVAPITPVGPSGMSQTTKTLLIGGGILAAGLIIYSLTKKK
jgi:hypothetical protein